MSTSPPDGHAAGAGCTSGNQLRGNSATPAIARRLVRGPRIPLAQQCVERYRRPAVPPSMIRTAKLYGSNHEVMRFEFQSYTVRNSNLRRTAIEPAQPCRRSRALRCGLPSDRHATAGARATPPFAWQSDARPRPDRLSKRSVRSIECRSGGLNGRCGFATELEVRTERADSGDTSLGDREYAEGSLRRVHGGG